MISAKIVLSSISANRSEIVTFVLKYPRFIHPQVMTHRVFSRNVSSSRAIPTKKLIETAIKSNIRPQSWGHNQKGMSPGAELPRQDQATADLYWNDARRDAIYYASQLETLGVHKQWVNRILEPYLPVTTIVTATDFTNFFNLRLSHEAQGEITELAEEMLKEKKRTPPTWIEPGDWHIPFILPEEQGISLEMKKKIAVARCARVSYKTPDDDLTSTPERDLALFERLKESGHWSPFEHVAMAVASPIRIANFVGWLQYRQLLDGYWGQA